MFSLRAIIYIVVITLKCDNLYFSQKSLTLNRIFPEYNCAISKYSTIVLDIFRLIRMRMFFAAYLGNV